MTEPAAVPETTAPKRAGWMSRCWKWTRRAMLTVMMLAILLCLAAWGYVAYYNDKGEKEITAALQKVSSLNIPTREQMLADSPAGKRPAPKFLLAVFELNPDRNLNPGLPIIGTERKNPQFGKPIPAETTKLLQSFMAENGLYFDLLQRALDAHERLGLLFTDDWIPITQGSGIRSNSKCLLVAALAAQAQNDADKAFKYYADAIRLQDTMDGQPLVIVGMIRTAMASQVRSSIEDALSRIEAPPTRLKQVRSEALAADSNLDLGSALMTELALAVEQERNPDRYFALAAYYQAKSLDHAQEMRDLFANMGTEASPPSPFDTSRESVRRSMTEMWLYLWLFPGSSELERAEKLRQTITALKEYNCPAPEAAKLLYERNRALKNPKEEGSSIRGYQMVLQGKATLRLIAATMAVEEYRMANHRWPATLAEIQPALPEDPFTGKPFVMKATDNGVLIYSVGPNLQNDGGKDYSVKGDDIVFRLLNPELRNKP